MISELVGDAAQMMNKDEEQFIQGMTAYGNIFETFPDLHQTIFRHSTQALQSLKKALDNPNVNRQTQIKIHVLLTKISQYYQTFA